MKQEVKRNYLEINSLQDLKESKLPSEDYSLDLLDPINFQLNKFFYKNIGKKHSWVDRLIWSEQQWIDYILSKKVKTYVFKHKDDLAGFFELIFHHENPKSPPITHQLHCVRPPNVCSTGARKCRSI